jgi:hypothetical protein
MVLQTQILWMYLRSRFIDSINSDEGGSVVETVIITAIFAALAIAIGTIIAIKVTSKANSINLN